MTVAQSEFVVRTKLRMPSFARAPIERERLLARFGETLSPFTMVSAPAGFGKTTLVTQLSAAWRDTVVWFQIDRLDSDPRRFVAHLLAAVQEEIPAFGRDHLDEVLQREVGANRQDIVRFINAVGELERGLILVLDDYHEIENPAVHALLAALLEHQPPGLAVVMVTRTEPPLPLGRLRARGIITETGAQDLRFDDREALTFVREGLALDLGEPLVTVLVLELRLAPGRVCGFPLELLTVLDRLALTQAAPLLELLRRHTGVVRAACAALTPPTSSAPRHDRADESLS